MSHGLRTDITKEITEENKWTKWVPLRGRFQVDITGVTASIVTLQRSRDGGVTPIEIRTFTEDSFYMGEVGATRCLYRVGIDTGNFGAGETVVIHLEA